MNPDSEGHWESPAVSTNSSNAFETDDLFDDVIDIYLHESPFWYGQLK